jgi:hypothetical protein
LLDRLRQRAKRIFMACCRFVRPRVNWKRRLAAMNKPHLSDERPEPLDAQLAQLIETVWAAEAMWRLENRIEAAR